eukprot:7568531-Lingulodinium_polyedra.AAC.1
MPRGPAERPASCASSAASGSCGSIGPGGAGCKRNAGRSQTQRAAWATTSGSVARVAASRARIAC